MTQYNKATDTEHEIKLTSLLVSAAWSAGVAYAGLSVGFEVRTAFVGQGSKIQVTGKSEGGKKLGKVKGEVKNNTFVGRFDIPENVEPGDRVFFEVKLPKNGLNSVSNSVEVRPAILAENMRWSAEEARRGDTLTLSADIEGAENGTAALITIYEYDRDEVHDKIAEIPTEVRDARIEVLWDYEYHEDTDEIPTQQELERYGGSYNPPEYFFTITVGDFELGRGQESGLLTFKDWLEIELVDSYGNSIANQDYEIHFPDGSTQEGTLDERGRAQHRDIPPGRCRVVFPGLVPEHEEVDVESDDIDRERAAEADVSDEERELERAPLAEVEDDESADGNEQAAD